MDGITDGPRAGDPPVVPQSANVVELNRALAQRDTEIERLKNALLQIEELTAGGKGQSAVNMIAQLALNSDVPIDDLEYQASQDVIIRETLLEVLSHAVDGVVSVEAIRAMEAAIEDLPAEAATLTTLRAELQAAKQTIADQEETIGGLEQNDAMIRAELATAHARIADLESVIEADRTRIIDGVNALNKVLRGRFWLTEGRGSYEWNDDRYRKEFGDAARAVLKAVEPLRKIGADLTNCPPTTDEVIAARRNKDARIVELERALQQIRDFQPLVVLHEDGTSAQTNGAVGYDNAFLRVKQIANTALTSTTVPKHPDTRRLDHLQKLIDDAKSDGNNLTIFPREGDDRQTIREYLDDAMKEATDA